MDNKKERIKYAAIFIILLCIEVIIALFVHDNIIRPYVGDMLVVILIYFALRIIIPRGFNLLPLWVFLFAAFIEVLQYFNFVKIIGLGDSAFFRILLGSTFDIKDILCYGVGAAFLFIYDFIGRVRISH